MTTRLRWLTAALLLLACTASFASTFDPGRTGFRISVNGMDNPYRVLAIPVMPEARVYFHSPDLPAAALSGKADKGTLTARGDRGWSWHAPPTPGHYPLTFRQHATGETMTFNMLVMTPRSAKANGRIENYRIGRYPGAPFRGLDAYLPPDGFIRVDPALADLAVSPHFTLGQFLSKQQAGWPRFVLIRPELMLVLEQLLETVNEEGIRTDGFVVMSGYRTPFYNTAIGNGRHSRHQWGGAADIYIDQRPPRGRMDDLTGDNRSTISDARVLAAIAERVMTEMDVEGGIGIYGSAPHRGPFVHVDVRGFPARWEF